MRRKVTERHSWAFLVSALAVGFLGAALMIWADRARGEDACPPEKPHRKMVVDMTKTVSCNAVLLTMLRCPRDDAAPCYWLVRSTCPPSASAAVAVCLSDDELTKSRERE